MKQNVQDEIHLYSMGISHVIVVRAIVISEGC
jgi:hypothetical protein